MYGEQAKYFEDEIVPGLKFNKRGLVAMANTGTNTNGSQFFITVAESLPQLNGKHTIFGELGEGLDVLMKINEAYTDEEGRPRQVIRIKHTIILEDPFEDPKGLEIPDHSPVPSREQFDELLDEEEMEAIGKPDPRPKEEIEKEIRAKEAKSREGVLTMVVQVLQSV